MNTASQASVARRATPNRLGDETSPYLLQHALNPVDWYPWGDEALERSKALDKPIFLSIGYSACHWCHVMEHESFEDDDIARLMNEHFVCIKVDREERPDLDQIYMTAVQLMTGRGGWPMSVFLTPECQPFFGGTYWPPRARQGMPGFRDILLGVNDAWRMRRQDVLRSADEMTDEIVRSTNQALPRSELNLELLRQATSQLLSRVDWREGGFGGAPKFPHPMDLRVLLRCWKRFGDERALQAVRLTLDKMAAGGIYDHLGGGFHRYSTDAVWLAPHFEKMLYDNALLTQAYLEVFQATGSESYRRVVHETLDYVLREMAQPGGGFFATQDADSEGEEGKFFVWTKAEILDVLGPDDGSWFCAAYDVSDYGNWEGHNILNRSRTSGSSVIAEDVLERCRAKLFGIRTQRIAPGRDDKILVNWNGLMIAAMSQAASVLNDSRYANAARSAADFILSSMFDDQGRLQHSFKDGRARFLANLDDYACLVDGLVDLYQVVFDPKYLAAAASLAERMHESFSDSRDGGFFFTAVDAESLIARHKDTQDNATPSGSGMASSALARVGALTGDARFLEWASRNLESVSGQLSRFAMASGQALLAVDFLLDPFQQVVIVAPSGSREEGAEAIAAMNRTFWPNKVWHLVQTDEASSHGSNVANSLLQGKSAVDGQLTVFVCEHGRCKAPIVGLAAWKNWLQANP